MAPVLEGKSIGSDQKTVLRGELLIWRTKNQARDQGIVQLKDSNDPEPSSGVGLREGHQHSNSSSALILTYVPFKSLRWNKSSLLLETEV